LTNTPEGLEITKKFLGFEADQSIENYLASKMTSHFMALDR